MKNRVSSKQLGLTVGLVSAIFHAIWALLVGLNIGQLLIDWIMPLHFIDLMQTVMPFNLINALWLVILAFVGGYIVGWIIAEMWNLVIKKVK